MKITPVELSAQEKEMLLRSEDDILHNRLISDEDLNAEEEDWLNQKTNPKTDLNPPLSYMKKSDI